MSRRVTNLLFPTPVWRIDLEASEELNATLLGQLKDVDWSAKARESEMRFGASLGRGGSRPSLLFPFNHPPTIRCSAK
jgi:hypothetical protein